MANLSRTARIYILSTILLGVLGGIWCARYVELASPVALVFACLFATPLQILKIEGATARSSYSLSWVVYAFVFASLGWAEMLITITVAHIGEWLWHRYPWYIQSFNIAGYAITTIVSGLIYVVLTALPLDFTLDFTGAQHTFALLVALLTFTVVNHFMIGLVIKLARGQSFTESGVLSQTTLVIDFGLLCLGVTAAIVAQTNLTAIVFTVIVALTVQSALRVPALAREAELTAEAARAANAKYEFVATMNHELRTPLNAVLLYAESLQRKLPGPLNERQERAVQGIHQSAQHLLLIINDILDVAKIDAGRLQLDIVPTEVENVCQSSLLLVAEMALKKQLDLRYHRSLNVIHMDVDEQRLRQMLVNLLSNAIKFTPEGGKVGLEVNGDTANDTVHFSVWDTGIGISQENIQKLFQPFVQIGVARAYQQGGTGLGLFLVHSMAELHGGSVSVTSETDHGSNFTISLPWHRQRPSLPAEAEVTEVTSVATLNPDDSPGERLTERPKHLGVASAEESSPLLNRKPTVLIADDNETNLHVLSEFLQEWRCHILVARTGIEAVNQTKKAHPDLVFMDVQMPEMDGLEAIRHIRSEPSLSHIPIVVLTAFATLDMQEKCLAAGANAYLSKPIHVERLFEMLHTLLGAMPAKDEI